MPVTQEQARELLDKYNDVLWALDEGVQRLGGMIPDARDDMGCVFHEQLASLVPEALKAIADGTPFSPRLQAKAGEELSEKHAFIEGDFGEEPNANRCLKIIFANLDNPLYETTFRKLRDIFLTEANQDLLKAFHKDISKLAFTAEAPEGRINLVVLKRLTKNLSGDTLNPYFGVMQELAGYATSSVEKEKMVEDYKVFQSIKASMQACVKAIKAMHDSGQVNKKEIEKQIKTLGRNLEDALAHLDKTHNFSLEGQGNAKPKLASGERGLWEIFCYNLVSLFRVLFTILSIGYFKDENPLAKKMGYGPFFIRTAKTVDEEKDIKTQREALESLGQTLEKTQKNLNVLVREVASLKHLPTPRK